MPKRSKDWNEGLLEDLKNTDFVKEFISAAINEGFSLQEVLNKMVHTVGIKEISAITGMAAPNILRTVAPQSNPTIGTLNKLLSPFNLKLMPTYLCAHTKNNKTKRKIAG